MPASGRWPALEQLLAAHHAGPPRTRSLIITVYGDAIGPRGGETALPALLTLMRRLGFTDGVVRTALSRLTADGWLDRIRTGRMSFYRLAARGLQEISVATPRIYGPLSRPWNGQLRIVLADAGTDRIKLDHAGYALVAPGVLIAPDYAAVPSDVLYLLAGGEPEAVRSVAGRVWPLSTLAATYSAFVEQFTPMLQGAACLAPLDAMGARVLLIHQYRRIILRDPHLPAALLPTPWPGDAARWLSKDLYSALAPASEQWLDALENASGPLPRGPDPLTRFSDGDRQPAAPA